MTSRSLTFLLTVLLGFASNASAYESHAVAQADGTQAFDVRFFNPSDGGFWFADGGGSRVSSWVLSTDQRTNILHAAGYWASVIRPLPGSTIGVLNIGTYDDMGAFGASVSVVDGDQYKVPLQVALQGEDIPAGQLPYDTHGIFAMGTMDWTPGVNDWWQIGDQPGLNMTAVAAHEVAHTLGVLTNAFYVSPTEPVFSPEFSTWSRYLVDDHGRPAHPGQAILCAACTNTDPNGFDVRLDQGMFVGPHVLDALAGGLPGIPVKMMRQDLLGNFTLDQDTMSHIELKNSLMSHQKYRNYTRFMEVELAVMQDLGYQIDRRDFFGRSVYGSGLDFVNTQGYFARNEDGSAYLDQQYSQTALGLGLHVYGSHNRIVQAADLLTAGAGAVGIRVDGEANRLSIAPGVRVHAHGTNGQGVMLVYGKNHELAVRGDVQALGQDGVGLRFDFGHNLGSGDAVEYRGSYLRTSDDGPLPMLAELDGSLASRVDISGTVAGSRAAIYQSDNALVDQIHILQGARLHGDIVSHYAQRDGQGNPRLTVLSFGQRADADGWATGQADDRFHFDYTGNIQGGGNLFLSFDGGQSRLGGTHRVWGAEIGPHALLTGSADYTLTGGSALLNQGVLAPGGVGATDALGHISIQGDYTQTATGMLLSRFDAQGQSDHLAVSGTADLQGALGLLPQRDWYANGWTQTIQPIQAGHWRGRFDEIRSWPSPTLAFAAVDAGAGQYRLGVTRAADAYSRYGRDANDRRAGQALWQLTAQGPGAAQSLLTSLDFSGPDGYDVTRALSQLSPSVYSAALTASLRRDRLASEAALSSMIQDRSGYGPEGGLDPQSPRTGDGLSGQGAGNSRRTGSPNWVGHAAWFGGVGRQDAQGSLVASRDSLYGIVIGGSRWLDSTPDLQLGLSLDASEQTVDLRSPWQGRARATAVGLGAQWRYQPDAWIGPYAQGGVRLGMERGRMTRKLSFADYAASHESSWTGYQASAQLAGGYQFALSDSASAGPFIALDYATLTRPAVDESGPQATRLLLDSQHTDALRSRLGLSARAAWDLADKSRLAAAARISWDREWLAQDVRQSARFAAQPGVSIDSVNALAPRNLLGLRASLHWYGSDRLSVGLEVGAQAGGGYQALDGQLNVRWHF